MKYPVSHIAVPGSSREIIVLGHPDNKKRNNYWLIRRVAAGETLRLIPYPNRRLNRGGFNRTQKIAFLGGGGASDTPSSYEYLPINNSISLAGLIKSFLPHLLCPPKEFKLLGPPDQWVMRDADSFD